MGCGCGNAKNRRPPRVRSRRPKRTVSTDNSNQASKQTVVKRVKR
tara:strand:- start:686 stop:820 length:135 start_codon:yes stop_codon:yes gene_type:complete